MTFACSSCWRQSCEASPAMPMLIAQLTKHPVMKVCLLLCVCGASLLKRIACNGSSFSCCKGTASLLRCRPKSPCSFPPGLMPRFLISFQLPCAKQYRLPCAKQRWQPYAKQHWLPYAKRQRRPNRVPCLWLQVVQYYPNMVYVDPDLVEVTTFIKTDE